MITFKQFITEQTVSVDDIIRDCQTILNVYKKTPKRLYHGTRGTSPILLRKWEERREPKDTPMHVHNAMNYNFKKKFDIEPRNWRFAGNSPGQTTPYGDCYVLFPVGQARYVWSDRVFDATDEYQILKSEYKKNYAEIDFDERVEMIIRDIKAHFADEYDYRYSDNAALPLASGVNHEIMFKCDEYYLVHYLSEEMDRLEEYIRGDKYEN